MSAIENTAIRSLIDGMMDEVQAVVNGLTSAKLENIKFNYHLTLLHPFSDSRQLISGSQAKRLVAPYGNHSEIWVNYIIASKKTRVTSHGYPEMYTILQNTLGSDSSPDNPAQVTLPPIKRAYAQITIIPEYTWNELRKLPYSEIQKKMIYIPQEYLSNVIANSTRKRNPIKTIYRKVNQLNNEINKQKVTKELQLAQNADFKAKDES